MYILSLVPRSHYLRPLTDGGFLTYPCVFPGCITKAICDSVFAYICITQSDWPTDLSLPEKFNISQLIDAGNGADRTRNAISRAPRAKSFRSINGRRYCERSASRCFYPERSNELGTRNKLVSLHRSEQEQKAGLSFFPSNGRQAAVYWAQYGRGIASSGTHPPSSHLFSKPHTCQSHRGHLHAVVANQRARSLLFTCR